MEATAPYIVGIGGTTRADSSTEKALRFVLAQCESRGAETVAFAGPELGTLPFYAPEHTDRVEEARRLVDELRRADGIVIASSSYHGGISGLVKNALDYTEDMREDERCYFTGLPMGAWRPARGGGRRGDAEASSTTSCTCCGGGRRRWAPRSTPRRRCSTPPATRPTRRRGSS